ncbi:MAG: DnaJ domain-containing protein [Deltaproteobacteria bacterium]|nr:DnaJ domain-containing protein [Deltaproteobacteria bacterium]
MTRKNALAVLRLPDSATREEIDRAYQRLVKRYPPEFNPEKFRQIDEAYNFLTSLPYLLEKLLSPVKLRNAIDKTELKFSPAPPASTPEQAMASLRKQLLLAYLWGAGQTEPIS